MAATAKQYVKQLLPGNILRANIIKGTSGNEIELRDSANGKQVEISANTAYIPGLKLSLTSTDPLATDNDGFVIAGV